MYNAILRLNFLKVCCIKSISDYSSWSTKKRKLYRKSCKELFYIFTFNSKQFFNSFSILEFGQSWLATPFDITKTLFSILFKFGIQVSFWIVWILIFASYSSADINGIGYYFYVKNLNVLLLFFTVYISTAQHDVDGHKILSYGGASHKTIWLWFWRVIFLHRIYGYCCVIIQKDRRENLHDWTFFVGHPVLPCNPILSKSATLFMWCCWHKHQHYF